MNQHENYDEVTNKLNVSLFSFPQTIMRRLSVVHTDPNGIERTRKCQVLASGKVHLS